MRPVRLTMQAFGPYPSREVIDFRNAVEMGLFGIYGQTGSGKSTIFSAMTFALFGQPTKADQESPSLRSDHADAAIHTEVEFVFDIGERRYVILRRPEQMRPKQRGGGETRSPHEAFLFDATGMALESITEEQRGKIIAEKKVRDVDTAIAEMLGYGPDQFRQIVLLPQGRFEKFLSAKTKERLEILRELFDVSLYRLLTTKLKTDAEAAERHVQEERQLCARRLNTEGFESRDALVAGIAVAETRHAELLTQEQAARAGLEAVQTAVREGEKIEAQFKAAEDAQEALAELEAGKSDMDSLGEQVARAERARSLLDIEANVAEAAGNVRSAEEKLKRVRETAVGADGKAKSAVDVLKKEMDRAGEIEDLRRRVDELDRHEQTLVRASGCVTAFETAQTMERALAGNLDRAQKGLTSSQNERRQKSEKLKAARLIEDRRKSMRAQLVALNAKIVAADVFEKAGKDVKTAEAKVATLISEHEAARIHAEKALANFDEAEQNLSAVQALHLASKLAEGEPCPVCGSTEHPERATGTIENAGLDQAFRDAKVAWEGADQRVRKAQQELAGARSVLKERQDRLADLEHPDTTGAELKESAKAEQRALDELGPETDIGEANAEIERLEAEIAALEIDRDALRNAHSEQQKVTTAEKARLEEILAAVPEALRDQSALAAAREGASQAFMARRTAQANAEAAAAAAREAALAAQKDQEAAEGELSLSGERHRKAVEAFRSRLASAGLSDEEFRATKPSIETIDEDRAMVDEHRRKLENAQENAGKTAEAIQQPTRPDLVSIEAQRHEADDKLTSATGGRVGAEQRLSHLTKLRDELAETLRKLDEDEVASGTLRNLAALVNGDNSQKLDLETFAIGAMFDQVLEAANLRLRPMTANRYRLERDLDGSGRGRRGLGIEVFDFFTGKGRSTATLSGGETFIAALALALGLADVVESASGKVRLDTIFIDEGFGSLDTENESGTLDKVLEVLNALVSESRAVGLISHVPLVQEKIPNGFYVRKHNAGSSVEVRGVG